MTGLDMDLAWHLAQDCTTVCHCWRLKRRDGTVLGFTDHDRPLTFGGTSYQPRSGLTRNEARATLGLGADATDVEGVLDAADITEVDITAGLYDAAEVDTYLVNWTATAQRHRLSRSTVGKITRRDGRFVAELESLARALDRPNGRYLRRSCDAELGDDRCRAELDGAAFNATGTVEWSNAIDMVKVTGLGDQEPGWFAFGRITWQSGALAGIDVLVKEHRIDAGGTFLVLASGAMMPAAGVSFSIRAGCDRSFDTCRAKFANALNFRGFPHLPGNDAAYAYVAEGLAFDGRPLVE